MNGMKTLSFDAVVVGSGCAGYNAADWLYTLGKKNIAVLTEGRTFGTSRNTGSDKQTYYKLSLAGDEGDSVMGMAKTLFSGGAVDGDTALAEAANSVRCFMKLKNLGVPFPTNEYGEFVGYKTDHDPYRRATSIGPYTSKKMTEVLEASVMEKNIPILDGYQAVSIVVENGRAVGLVAIDRNVKDRAELVGIKTPYIILAVGGPAGIYKDSVYPESQTGGSELALEAGAGFVNLDEWQYGLASVDFRWNVSGTYQQVLPRYISVDESGIEREFLTEYFSDSREMLKNIFLKGYEWPFDVRKLRGSSYIDLLVYNETVIKGRKVYLDYTREPSGLEGGFEGLDETVYDYLKNSDALTPLPIERLRRMNPRAVSLYGEHGIDITKEPLRIAVCAQHCNGGIAVDSDWQTDIKGLYAVGECAGTFGIFRPGGTALNSTQVGSLRAAEHIVYGAENDVSPDSDALINSEAERISAVIAAARGDASSVSDSRRMYQIDMSRDFAFIREKERLGPALASISEKRRAFDETEKWSDPKEVPDWLKNRGILAMQEAVASSVRYAAETFGSRGSSLVIGSGSFMDRCPEPEDEAGRELVVTAVRSGGNVSVSSRPVRPVPERELWFEKVWNSYNRRTEGKS